MSIILHKLLQKAIWKYYKHWFFIYCAFLRLFMLFFRIYNFFCFLWMSYCHDSSTRIISNSLPNFNLWLPIFPFSAIPRLF